MHRVESLHFPQFLERGEKIMVGIKRSALPVFKLGRTATEAIVTITDNGQLRFNVLAMKALGGVTKPLFIGWDDKTRLMVITPNAPKNWPQADLFTARESKGGGGYISCSALWGDKENGILYDFHKSGSQHFKPTVDADKNKLSFSVPKGALTPLPRQIRVKKAEKADVKAKGAAAGASSGDEISLDD